MRDGCRRREDAVVESGGDGGGRMEVEFSALASVVVVKVVSRPRYRFGS